jgi:hypothetical protein
MKKLLTLLSATVLFVGLSTAIASADAGKGQKIFIKEMKPVCGFDGGTMAKKHTQAEWKTIQEAGKLNEEMIKFCPEAKPLKDAYVEHVFDFLHNYASDSGNVPAC